MLRLRLSRSLRIAHHFYIGDRLGGWYGPAHWEALDDGSFRVGWVSPRDGAELGVALLSDREIAIDAEGIAYGTQELEGDREVVLKFEMTRPLSAADVVWGTPAAPDRDPPPPREFKVN